MSLETFRDEDFRQMKQIERAIVAAILPFSANTDPILGLLALLRCARVLLRKAPAKAAAQLLPVCIAYLRGEIKQPGRQSELLWMPGDDDPNKVM
jgi:hypothetical protein